MKLMPIIQFFLLADLTLISYGQNPRITGDSSVLSDLILWIQSLEFQKQCRAVVNCLIFLWIPAARFFFPSDVRSKYCFSKSHKE